MTALESSSAPVAAAWTCPFCPLLCDRFAVVGGPSGWALQGSDCPRAHHALARFDALALPAAQPSIAGAACALEDAVDAAARVLAASRQPLFGGLGTDGAGARALYPLACRTGAICDPAGGAALFQGLRALQDRGGFTATLAEVRTRADLIVCVGSLPSVRYPEFLRRCGVGEGGTAQIVLLQPSTGGPQDVAPPGIESIRVDGDLFDLVAMLAACVADREVGGAGGPLVALAQRLHESRYAVLAYETAQLPAHGALIVEAVNRTVGTLNQRTRAAALPLGGGDGASTVNAVFTWLSGLPLRTRAAPAGLEHEPLRFDAQRLLADGAVDALLWIASFGTEPAPPASALPRIVLGHPVFEAASRSTGCIFIPVATPGVGAAGHLFRTDGSVLMPLRALRDDGLPTVAEVLRRIALALPEVSA
ncbi:MAG: formylmethanofuran dehydrogenase [Pseudomonadota bacterium]